MLLARSPIALVLGGLVAASCRSPKPPTERAATRLDATATRAAAPDADAAAPDAADAAAADDEDAPVLDLPPTLAVLVERPATSWTDPRMLAALAADCDANNPNFEAPANNPLHCFFQFAEQSCSVDPCSPGEHDPCEVDCGERCESCEAGCRVRCRRCRARCDGGLCGPQCASACAACMNGCIERRDRCATAVCAVRHEACARLEAQRFHGSGCAAECARCTRRCERAEDPPVCVERCLRRRPACSEIHRRVCAFGEGPEYGLRYLDGGLDGDASDANTAATDATTAGPDAGTAAPDAGTAAPDANTAAPNANTAAP
jgi:hypothetical protein